MNKKVIILTPSSGFGELIRQALEAHGDFNGSLADNVEQAINALNLGEFELLIIDAEIGYVKIEKLLIMFRNQENNGKLLLLPTDDGSGIQTWSKFKIDKVLSDPFYLPDLIEALDDLFSLESDDSPEVHRTDLELSPSFKDDQTKSVAPEWIHDSHIAAQYLMRLSLESSAQAAFISYKDQMWAYSGELSQSAAESLVSTISSRWDRDAVTDLARFVHLDETQSDYMLYATNLGGNYALGLVFDTKIPFSKMRQQALNLAEALAKTPDIQVAVPVEVQKRQKTHSSAIEDGLNDSIYGDDFKPELPIYSFFDDQEKKQKSPESKVVEQSFSDKLLFSYLFIPRFPSHQLRGDISFQLSVWLPQMCVAYAWRLEHFEINENFLRWTIEISSKHSPKSVAKIMAKQLSKRIFAEFSSLKNENPSRQFWVPKPLILSGDHISKETIDIYMRETRAAQGISS